MSQQTDRIFISHSRADSQFARALSRALTRDGWNVVSDLMMMRVGARLTDELERALDSSSWYVVIVSDAALRSPWVNFELGAALGQRKRVLPIFRSRKAMRQATGPLSEIAGIVAEGLRPTAVAEKLTDVL